MDYKLFPNEKKVDLNRECEDELQELDKYIDDMRKKTDEQIQKKNKGTLGGTFVGIVVLVIVVVVPFVVCVQVCNNVSDDNIWNKGFVGIIVGLVSMAITGVVLWGVAFLISSICSRTKNRATNQFREEAEHKMAEERNKKRIDIENSFRHKEATYKKEFYEESDRRTAKFAGNPVTDEIVNWMAEILAQEINKAERGPQTIAVQRKLEFSIVEEKVKTHFGEYVFVDHRVSDLADAADAMALAKAVGTGLQAEIMARFPIDPMGTPVKVNAAYTDGEHMALGRVNYSSEKEDKV